MSVRREQALLVGDYHIHSRWSDGRGEVAELVAAAAALSLPEIGLSDHVVPAALDDGYGLPLERLDEYCADVRAAAVAAAAPRVLLGVEADFSPDTWPALRELLACRPVDYVIGSVHSVDGAPVDLDAALVERRWPRADELFVRYYECVAALAAAGGADVLGHLDLPKKFGRRPSPAVRPAEDRALDAVAAAGMLLEVSTAGLRCAAAEPYPAAELLARARARGIRVTFGSDAHRPEDVGHAFPQALRYAYQAGYRHWVRLSDGEEVRIS